MLPEVRMARVLDAISSHRAGRLSCVEAGEVLGFSVRQFGDCGPPKNVDRQDSEIKAAKDGQRSLSAPGAYKLALSF